MIASTGPKISSWAIRMQDETSEKTVGATKKPSPAPSGRCVPPVARRALRDADLDVLAHPFVLRARHEGPEFGAVVGRVADAGARPRPWRSPPPRRDACAGRWTEPARRRSGASSYRSWCGLRF